MIAAEPHFLREQAARFRRLAREIVDDHAQRELIALALEDEAKAAEASQGRTFRWRRLTVSLCSLASLAR